jgi:hypothetical protein
VGLSLAELGQVELALRKPSEAGATLRTALGHLEETLGPEHPAALEARRTAELAVAAR